jgi:putative membrane protein
MPESYHLNDSVYRPNSTRGSFAMKKNLVSALTLVLMLAVAVTFARAADTGLSNRDKQFIEDAADYGIFEVQLGEIAQERGESQGVKDFGILMVTDHGKANAELKQIAKKYNFTVSDQLDPKYKETIDRLLKLTGADFDYEYTKVMVKDHKKNSAAFKKFIGGTKNPDLKNFALKTDQVIGGHLKQAEYLADKFGLQKSW